MAMLKGELELNGKAIFTEEGIRNNFSPKEVLSYFKSGRLIQVCSNNPTLKEKLDSINTDMADSLIINELANLFGAEFNLEKYLKQEKEELEKEMIEKQRIEEENKKIDEQKRKHEEIKFLDGELKKYLKKSYPNYASSVGFFRATTLGATLFCLSTEERIDQIKNERFKSRTATEIKKIIYEKIKKKQLLSSDEIFILKSWYGSK